MAAAARRVRAPAARRSAGGRGGAEEGPGKSDVAGEGGTEGRVGAERRRDGRSGLQVHRMMNSEAAEMRSPRGKQSNPWWDQGQPNDCLKLKRLGRAGAAGGAETAHQGP